MSIRKLWVAMRFNSSSIMLFRSGPVRFFPICKPINLLLGNDSNQIVKKSALWRLILRSSSNRPIKHDNIIALEKSLLKYIELFTELFTLPSHIIWTEFFRSESSSAFIADASKQENDAPMKIKKTSFHWTNQKKLLT